MIPDLGDIRFQTGFNINIIMVDIPVNLDNMHIITDQLAAQQALMTSHIVTQASSPVTSLSCSFLSSRSFSSGPPSDNLNIANINDPYLGRNVHQSYLVKGHNPKVVLEGHVLKDVMINTEFYVGNNNKSYGINQVGTKNEQNEMTLSLVAKTEPRVLLSFVSKHANLLICGYSRDNIYVLRFESFLDPFTNRSHSRWYGMRGNKGITQLELTLNHDRVTFSEFMNLITSGNVKFFINQPTSADDLIKTSGLFDSKRYFPEINCVGVFGPVNGDIVKALVKLAGNNFGNKVTTLDGLMP